MYEFNATHVVTAFKKAHNLNAAVKAYLKLQGNGQDAKAVRFAKDLREVVQNSNTERLATYVSGHFEAHQETLVAIAACAHSDLISGIIAQIADKYSDEFNSTYELNANGIKLKEPKDFDRIAQEAIAFIGSELKAKGWDDAAFLKAVAVNQLFDKNVLAELDRKGFLK